MSSDTYIIADPDEVWGYGPCLGTITDALSGAAIAYFRGGHRVPLNTPLCTGCDAPVIDGECADCADPLPVARAA